MEVIVKYLSIKKYKKYLKNYLTNTQCYIKIELTNKQHLIFKEEITMMNTKELVKKIEELKELEALIREAEAEVEALKDEIKNEMQNREEMNAGRYIVRWTNVSSSRFDSKTFKTACPDIYNMYVKQTVSKRFSITG